MKTSRPKNMIAVMHAKSTFKLALIIALVHISLTLLPFMLYESDITAWLPYSAYFGVASLLHQTGLPVIGPCPEGMFMAELTLFGQCAVYGTWCLVYVGMAALVSFVRAQGISKVSASSQPAPAGRH